jgi:syntaxin 1B/2/3
MRVDNHRQLSNAFLAAMRRYQKMQETYQDKYKAQLQRQYLIVKPRATQEELAELTRDPDAMKVQVFAMNVKEESKKTLVQMKGRLQDMQKLEQSILELNQLFLEMQDLVVGQGDVINKIGYNVDQIEEYTAKAAQDLEQAVESQKAIQKKKWLMLMIIGIVILIVLLVTIGPPLLKFLMEVLVLETLTGWKH